MVVLSAKLVKGIENILEPGYTVELEVEGNKVKVNRRPTEQDTISISPTVISRDQRVTVELRAVPSGEDAIALAQVIIPPGFCITGIAGGQMPEK